VQRSKLHNFNLVKNQAAPESDTGLGNFLGLAEGNHRLDRCTDDVCEWNYYIYWRPVFAKDQIQSVKGIVSSRCAICSGLKYCIGVLRIGDMVGTSITISSVCVWLRNTSIRDETVPRV